MENNSLLSSRETSVKTSSDKQRDELDSAPRRALGTQTRMILNLPLTLFPKRLKNNDKSKKRDPTASSTDLSTYSSGRKLSKNIRKHPEFNKAFYGPKNPKREQKKLEPTQERDTLEWESVDDEALLASEKIDDMSVEDAMSDAHFSLDWRQKYQLLNHDERFPQTYEETHNLDTLTKLENSYDTEFNRSSNSIAQDEDKEDANILSNATRGTKIAKGGNEVSKKHNKSEKKLEDKKWSPFHALRASVNRDEKSRSHQRDLDDISTKRESFQSYENIPGMFL